MIATPIIYVDGGVVMEKERQEFHFSINGIGEQSTEERIDGMRRLNEGKLNVE